MNDLEGYLTFAGEHPAMFANPEGAVFTILLDRADIARVQQEMETRHRANGASEEQAWTWSRVGFVYSDQYLCIARDAVRFPDGSVGTYIRILDPDASAPGVVMLPVYQGQVILVHHFRHALRDWFLELPRGFGIAGNSSEETVRQELAEEIGAIPTRIIPLGDVHPDTGMMSDRVELFYVDIESYGLPDAREGIDEIRFVTIDLFESLLRNRDITCGFTLAAYARAKLMGLL